MHDAKNAQSALAQQIAQTIADEIGAQSAQVRAAVGLLDEGASVPFIARYRKEVTGGPDDTQLRNPEVRLTYLRELEDRRAAVLASIGEQGKLSDELRNDIRPPIPRAVWKTCICRTSPSAVPAPRSPARRGWSRWPMACWPTRRRTRRALRPASSMPKRRGRHQGCAGRCARDPDGALG